MSKKPARPVYAAVVEMNGMRMYSRFAHDPQELIRDAEGIYTGIIAVEKAHAGEPPIWTRSA